MANKKQGRVINVCVVGLSGNDFQEKRLYGVGKSCFCNRFVKPAQDDYYREHRSVFTTSEFFGSVINGDQFLYWGSVEKCYDEVSITFKVVEQTEFIDDVSNLPLTKGGQLQPYQKRATAIKLTSTGKLMYICRDQVALQPEYEQIQMDRDGRFHVDGFICVYDVSTTLNDHVNNADIQERTLSALLVNIQKTKKPVVVVATKCDIGSDETLQKAHTFVNTRKIPTPLVESSASKNININLTFQALSQLIDTKNRHIHRPRLISYSEGLLLKNEKMKCIDKAFLILVKESITNSKMRLNWNTFRTDEKDNGIFTEYVELHGSNEARQVFNQQVKKVKRWFEDKKLNEYMKRIPNALDELLPSLHSIEANGWNWERCQKAIKNHILFDNWFEILSNNSCWNKPERLISDISTSECIPFDVLQVERSRACFDSHIKKLRESARKVRMKAEFRKLLELTSDIRPGTSWSEAATWICQDECYRYLDENERKTIFETHLREITLKAKLDFQELLFESANRLYSFSELIKDQTPTFEELAEIHSCLKNDERYKNLENVGNARDILLFNHIALMQHPNRCLSGPEKCMDRLMQQVVELTARRNTHNHYENEIFRNNEDEVISILVLGEDRLAKQLENKIKDESSSYECLEYIVDGQIYSLNIKVYVPEENESVDDLPQVIRDFKPQGYLAIYSSLDSLNFVDKCVSKIDSKYGDNCRQMLLPLILLLAKDQNVQESEVTLLRNEGQNFANRMECIFVDYPYSVIFMEDFIHESQVQDAIRGMVDIINKRTSPPTHMPNNKAPADVRIMLCAMCGDEFPVELILGTMLQHHTSYSNPENQDTVMLEAALGGTRKIISVTLGSYHRAYSLKNQLFHGFILVYSATRLASLESLRAFASILPNHVPVQVLEVNGAACSASIVFHEESSMFLVSDGSTLSHLSKLRNKPQQSFRNQAGAFLNFFNNVHDRRADTELIQQGIKPRRQDPLPAVPRLNSPTQHGQQQQDQLQELSLDEGNYAQICDPSTSGPTSPYIEVAFRHFEPNETESLPSSPDPTPQSPSDSREADLGTTTVEYDENGLYARVNKKQTNQLTYMKKLERPSEDEDDDIMWEDNCAYETRISVTGEQTPKRVLAENAYNTVPLPKSAKPVVEYEKAGTLPSNFSTSKPSGWNEPTYESIEQIKIETNKIIGDLNATFEPGSISSVSTKASKESQNSLLEGEVQIQVDKTPESSTTWYVSHDDSLFHRPGSSCTSAPLATPEDDENDLDELREQLESTLLNSTPRTTTAPGDNVRQRIKSASSEQGSNKKRSSSHMSSQSLDPNFQRGGLFQKFISKVSPAPSPGNSDCEGSDTHAPQKQKLRKSFRKRKPPQQSSPLKDNDEETVLKDRANTMPDKQQAAKKPHSKSLFKPVPFISVSNERGKDSLPRNYQTQTLDRKKHKKIKPEPKTKSKDDSDVPNTHSQDKKSGKLKHLSMKRKGKNISRQMDEWTKRQQKAKNPSSYFGRPLKEICESGSKCPVFFEKVIKHLELNGVATEGIYRVPGNKQSIEAVVKKFEENHDVNLQELGVAVHAITGALKHFFTQLPQPLIPKSFTTRINEIMILMDATERQHLIRELVYQLPEPNLEVYKMLMCHLNKVCSHKGVNKMDARNLQIVLYPTLMRPNFESQNMALNMTQTMNGGLFIQTCIEQSRTIFEEYYRDLESNELDTTNEVFNTTDFEGDSKLLENNDEADTGYSHDELDNCTVNDEPSFMESVMSDPSMESMINSSCVTANDRVNMEVTNTGNNDGGGSGCGLGGANDGGGSREITNLVATEEVGKTKSHFETAIY